MVICLIAINLTSPVLADEIGVAKLQNSIISQIDSKVQTYSSGCYASSVGVVYGGKIVYTKSYGSDHLTSVHDWASVSKPLTALLTMQLRDVDHKITSIDDEIWKYTSTYHGKKTAMPGKYASCPLTIKHLLTHRSGIPHLSSIFDGSGNLNLAFCPGQNISYATNGFAMIGDIIEAITGQDYAVLVKTRIADKIGASSLSASSTNSQWISPGAYVKSNITDFARYTIGVIDNTFISSNTFYKEMLKDYGSTVGLGFRVEGSGNDIAAFHSGSNGTPRSYMYIKPLRKRSVAFFCQISSGTLDMATLTRKVDDVLASVSNPCVNSSDCNVTSATPTTIITQPSPSPTLIPSPTPPSFSGCSRKSQGDANCDGMVNGVDYSLWLNSQCRKTTTQSCTSTAADFNSDGNVDDTDYNIWFDNRG